MTRPYLLLDAGNTLVHVDHAAIARALAEGGIDLDPERLRRAEWATRAVLDTHDWATKTNDSGRWGQYVGGILVRAGLDEREARGWIDRIRAIDRARSLWRHVPGEVRRGLDRLAGAGVRMAVVSNSDGRVRALLTEAGLAGAFEFVLDSAEEGVEKPDPEIFRRALSRAGVSAQGAVYAGDIYHVDVVGARSAGIEGILLDPGDHRADLDCARVRDLEELAERLLAAP